MVCTSPRCCALFVKHFKNAGENGHVHVALPPLYRIDLGKEVYALTEEEGGRAGTAEAQEGQTERPAL